MTQAVDPTYARFLATFRTTPEAYREAQNGLRWLGAYVEGLRPQPAASSPSDVRSR